MCSMCSPEGIVDIYITHVGQHLPEISDVFLTCFNLYSLFILKTALLFWVKPEVFQQEYLACNVSIKLYLAQNYTHYYLPY